MILLLGMAWHVERDSSGCWRGRPKDRCVVDKKERATRLVSQNTRNSVEAQWSVVPFLTRKGWFSTKCCG
jgi:hypothetical protein